MQTLWKKTAALHPTFAPINSSLRQDWFLLPYELELQRAHAKALRDAAILSDDEHASLCGALDEIATRHTGEDVPESDAEDLHTWIESRLVEATGAAGRKIHTARSRNDQVATLLKLYIIASGERLSEALGSLIQICASRARQWCELIFPLQTHCQFAAPGNVGFWLLRYATAFDRTRRHVEYCRREWKRFCPLGSAAVAGSSIPIDRGVQAAELGFGQPSLNALDSTSTRDECLELLSLAAQTALHLQSLATDVIAFSQTPFGWTVYPMAFGTGSSMMPNKANPDAMELLRGECNQVPASWHQATLILKGLPSGYNRDLQCIKPVVHGAVEKILALGSMTVAFLDELEFDESNLSASLEQGEVDATLRMEQKVLAGAPLRDAHHAIAEELQDVGRDSRNHKPAGAGLYQTVGSAGPQQTRRVAEQLLAGLES